MFFVERILHVSHSREMNYRHWKSTLNSRSGNQQRFDNISVNILRNSSIKEGFHGK